MKIYFEALFIICLFLNFKTLAQNNNQQWELLSNEGKEKIWYDESSLDTLRSPKFNVWILEMYNPPLDFQEINSKVFRSKIQYSIDLELMKYGILKVVYFGLNNKTIYDFDYHIENYVDSLKYTYPINDSPLMVKFINQVKKKFIRESSITQ